MFDATILIMVVYRKEKMYNKEKAQQQVHFTVVPTSEQNLI